MMRSGRVFTFNNNLIKKAQPGAAALRAQGYPVYEMQQRCEMTAVECAPIAYEEEFSHRHMVRPASYQPKNLRAATHGATSGRAPPHSRCRTADAPRVARNCQTELPAAPENLLQDCDH